MCTSNENLSIFNPDLIGAKYKTWNLITQISDLTISVTPQSKVRADQEVRWEMCVMYKIFSHHYCFRAAQAKTNTQN